MPRKKVTFVKTEEVKEGKFKGLKKGVKSKKMSEKRAQKKQAKGQGFISKAYDSNPIEMSPYKMESAGQEKYNLMHDNPVAKHGSWMSKHSKSAFQMGHSPLEQSYEEAVASAKERDFKDPKYLAEIAKRRRDYELRSGRIDPKTGERKKEHTFDYNYIRGKDPKLSINRKTGDVSRRRSSGFPEIIGNINENLSSQVPDTYEGELNFKRKL